jgi:hypothetical protein
VLARPKPRSQTSVRWSLVPDATVAPTQVVAGYGLLTDGHETSVYRATA